MTLHSVRDTDGNTLWFPSKKAAKRHQVDHNRADRKAAKDYKKENKGNPEAMGYSSVTCMDPKIHKVEKGKANMVTFLNSQTGGD